METKNTNTMTIATATNVASDKVFNRVNTKIGCLQAKEMHQVANEKTLNKNLSSTRQKLANLQYMDVETMKKDFIKHVNFCERKRKSSLCDFDAKVIKNTVNETMLFDCLDERGLNAVKCLSLVIGALDKELKAMQKKQQKELAKLSK